MVVPGYDNTTRQLVFTMFRVPLAESGEQQSP